MTRAEAGLPHAPASGRASRNTVDARRRQVEWHPALEGRFETKARQNLPEIDIGSLQRDEGRAAHVFRCALRAASGNVGQSGRCRAAACRHPDDIRTGARQGQCSLRREGNPARTRAWRAPNSCRQGTIVAAVGDHSAARCGRDRLAASRDRRHPVEEHSAEVSRPPHPSRPRSRWRCRLRQTAPASCCRGSRRLRRVRCSSTCAHDS